MKITIFSEELRECLNAAGLSDCGENDAWNYWYQRLMNAYNESVERQIMTEQAENAKLRETLKVLMMGTNAELCSDRDEADCRMCSMHHGEDGCTVVDAMELLGIDMYGMPLGIEVDE